jgi:integrase
VLVPVVEEVGGMKGATYKRCGCRGEDGRQLGKACPRLGAKGHGRWYYVLDVGTDERGRRKQKKKGSFATRAEAEQKLREAMGRADQGLPLEDKTTTGEWLKHWLKEKTKATGTSAAGKTIRPATAALYSAHVDYLLPHLGHVPLAKLRPEHVSAALDAVLRDSQARGGGMGPVTLRRVHAALRGALNVAVKARRISYNPAVHVELPETQRRQVQPWSPLELGTFLDATAAHRLGSLFEVMATSGLRRGEALGLRWSDLDLDAG